MFPGEQSYRSGSSCHPRASVEIRDQPKDQTSPANGNHCTPILSGEWGRGATFRHFSLAGYHPKSVVPTRTWNATFSETLTFPCPGVPHFSLLPVAGMWGEHGSLLRWQLTQLCSPHHLCWLPLTRQLVKAALVITCIVPQWLSCSLLKKKSNSLYCNICSWGLTITFISQRGRQITSDSYPNPAAHND